MAKKYSSRVEAINAEIVDPLENNEVVSDAWAEFDVEAIAAEVLGDYSAGYVCKVEPGEFWEIAFRHTVEVSQ